MNTIIVIVFYVNPNKAGFFEGSFFWGRGGAQFDPPYLYTQLINDACLFPDNFDFKGKIMAKFLIRSHFLSIWNNMTIK